MNSTSCIAAMIFVPAALFAQAAPTLARQPESAAAQQRTGIDPKAPPPIRQPSQKASAAQNQTGDTRVFGQSYATLRPEQKHLIDEYVRRLNQVTGSQMMPEQAYDGSRMSLRTTFDAVTHALLTTKLSNDKGQNLGRAIDLVDGVDEVLGEESAERGDRQFRMYVYLRPGAFDVLADSREFFRDKENTTYHKGFPLCFRLKRGPPSIQFSISRDERMSDIDVDYRSSKIPQALFNGHLTAANSDVRAGNNLETHDKRWVGLNGWWREIFESSLGSGAKPPREATTGRARTIPLNPRVTADQGIDASAHDFLKSLVVDKESNNAVAYLSSLSYPCLEEIGGNIQNSPGLVRIRFMIAMDNFNATIGNVTSVTDVFEAAEKWSPELKAVKNAYPTEFRLVGVPLDMALDEECAPPPVQRGGKQAKGKLFATVFRVKQGNSRNRVIMLLWTQEHKYWKVVAIRNEDSNDAAINPKKAAVSPPVTEAEPEQIAGDPEAVREITSFYQSWIGKRNAFDAVRYTSERLYQCLAAPSEAEKATEPAERVRKGLEMPLPKIPVGPNLFDMMSATQSVNELVRPVEHQNSRAFAIMAVPDQMADSFLCKKRHLREKAPLLKPNDAKYGTYYLSDSQLNFGDEESPPFLLLWTKEKDRWKIIAWAAEVP